MLKDIFLKQESDNLPRCLSPDEKKRFFEKIGREDLRCYFQLLVLTGCRRNEALHLEWHNVDWERRQITFRKTKSKSDRIMRIGLELMQILLKLDSKQPRPFNLKSDYVTPAFKKIAALAGLNNGLHLHCLRHTAASDLVRQGVRLSKVQKLPGHTSAQITERILMCYLKTYAKPQSCWLAAVSGWHFWAVQLECNQAATKIQQNTPKSVRAILG
ncbi:MAG TPA: site-specific integrase [bacterium]|jgi:integrase